jgi:hypothetical protein
MGCAAEEIGPTGERAGRLTTPDALLDDVFGEGTKDQRPERDAFAVDSLEVYRPLNGYHRSLISGSTRIDASYWGGCRRCTTDIDNLPATIDLPI